MTYCVTARASKSMWAELLLQATNIIYTVVHIVVGGALALQATRVYNINAIYVIYNQPYTQRDLRVPLCVMY